MSGFLVQYLTNLRNLKHFRIRKKTSRYSWHRPYVTYNRITETNLEGERFTTLSIIKY